MLSILIPTYNYNILPLIEELQSQAVKSTIAFEIIVLDDCSAPAYSDLNRTISGLFHCRYLENETNLGRTLSRRKLAKAATFDTLLFLDADVIPFDSDFIENYIPFIGYDGIVCGGIAYKENVFEQNTVLRYKYGRSREQKLACDRNKNPYGSIFSGNLLLPKRVFLENNYSGGDNLYGMDIFFAYSLYRNRIPVKHIDNPIYHLGLEENSVFFTKCKEAVKNRKEMLHDAKGVEDINSLLRHYKSLKKYGLAPVAGFFFGIAEPLLKKMILKKDPNLFCLDLYRLGYICSLK